MASVKKCGLLQRRFAGTEQIQGTKLFLLPRVILLGRQNGELDEL